MKDILAKKYSRYTFDIATSTPTTISYQLWNLKWSVSAYRSSNCIFLKINFKMSLSNRQNFSSQRQATWEIWFLQVGMWQPTICQSLANCSPNNNRLLNDLPINFLKLLQTLNCDNFCIEHWFEWFLKCLKARDVVHISEKFYS